MIIFLAYVKAQNYALDFNGSNEYVQINDDNSIDISNGITISAWIYPTDIANKDGIISKRTSTENNGDWVLRFTSSAKLKWLVWDGNSSNGSTSSNSSISLNTWSHVALTHNNSTNTTKFYINGLLDATSSSLSKNIDGNNSNLFIGWDGQQGDKFFTGKIDEIRIWDNVRTQVEIKTNMHTELSGSENGLVAYYNMNGGSGTTLIDNSNNSNNGTMKNMNASSDWVSNTLFAQNYALDFDGINDQISIPYNNSLDVINQVTIEAWVKPSHTDWQNIWMKGNYGYGFSLTGSNTSCQSSLKLVFWDQNTCSNAILSTNTYINNDWQHVAVTVVDNGSGLTVYFYINGVEDGPHTSNQTAINNGGSSSEAYISRQGTGCNCNFMAGSLDEVRIWNDVRTQTEIQDNIHTELTGNENNLIAYYNFNDGRGMTVLDKTSNNNNGTLINMDANSDWINSKILGTSISGNSGFRMLSSPVSGQILGNLLNNLWTQGMIGADVTSGSGNIWTLNLSSQSWMAVNDISAAGFSLSPGQGFLIYVFEDTDFDGTADLPAIINVNGSENSGDATISNVPANAWVLAGNPYASTIDWDLIASDNNPFYNTAYVWDDATNSYKSWNGSSGSLTNGLIAPYQAFWVQNTFLPNQTLTISESHKVGKTGMLYRISDVPESGSVTFDLISSELSDKTFISFQNEGEEGLDHSDGYKLLPLNYADRIVAISYADGIGLDINNLPYDNEEQILIPFDVIKLELDENIYVTLEEDVTLSWDISNLPNHISLKLIDQVTNTETNMNLISSITFTTQYKGSFSNNYSGTIGTYPLIGDPRFSLIVNYDVLNNTRNINMFPVEFALHPPYPNPFNPSTTLSFEMPKSGHIFLNIYDIKGSLIKSLLNEYKAAGTYQYKWTPKNELASGVYFFELKTKNETERQKITFVK
tara:strand:- start:2244 stop:5030 length:2787 start_codon:yes stop_codon:yes gene_type:complete